MVRTDELRWDSDPWWHPRTPDVATDDRVFKSSADLTIADLAADNTLLRERVTSLHADVQVYRQMVRVLLTRVHDLQQQRRP